MTIERWGAGGRRRRTVAAALMLGMLAAGLSGGVTTAATAGLPEGGAQASGEPVLITLITGEQVLYNQHDPSTGPLVNDRRPGIDYEIYQRDGRWYVLPVDAGHLVRSGRVDEALFDITGLVEQGFTGDRPLPVLLDYDQPGAEPAKLLARGQASLAGRPQKVLESVGAVAVEIDLRKKGQVWAALTPSGQQNAALSGGIHRLLLDRLVRTTLDVSVPQVGALQAWAAGYDGTGVKVAVLDTGVDRAHPDLAGRVVAERSFVAGETVVDGNGHGTHVAATVAGGSAGESGRKGVAPGARLVVGKVLGDNGSGSLSGILDGMEWAVSEAGADVVNMSLGAEPGPGSDLLDESVNRLTAAHDALFVIAAGNSGPGESTLNSPGTASSALTVGAVDKADGLASFSSRGPRLGDSALKPELSAPGVAIVAARAAGTSMGSPAGPLHTAASGTSMATPHVAGAAAIMAQAHPNWTPEQVKAALIGSARNLDQSVFAQGAGRLDLAQAVGQQVLADPAVVSFGRIAPDDVKPREQVLTYRNPGSTPVKLLLSASFTGGSPAGEVKLSAPTLDVPAGGSADVTLTVSAAAGEGNWSGHVTATAPGLRVTTPIGLVRGEPYHRLVVKFIDFDGSPLEGGQKTITAGRVDRAGGNWTSIDVTAAAGTLVVAAGTYSVSAWTLLDYRNHQLFANRYLDAVHPEVEISADTEVVFDLRKTRPVTIATDRPGFAEHAMSLYERRPEGGSPYRRSLLLAGGDRTVWVLPTAESVRKGRYDAGFITTRSEPQLSVRTGRNTYHPRYAWTGGERPAGERPALPMFPAGRRSMRVVDCGRGDQPVTARVKGAVVLLRLPTTDFPEQLEELSRKLREAGALGVLVAESEPGRETGVNALSGHLQLPSAALSRAEGARLAAQLRAGQAMVGWESRRQPAYAYHLAYYWRDSVPTDHAYTARDKALTTVQNDFRSDTDRLYRLGNSVVRSDMFWNLPVAYEFWAPAERTDYYGPTGTDLRWRRMVFPYEGPGLLQVFSWDSWDEFARPERRTETWQAAPHRLGQVTRTAEPPTEPVPYLASRQGDTLYPVPQRVGGRHSTQTGAFLGSRPWPGPQLDGGSVTVELRRDGVSVEPRSDGPATVFDLPAAKAKYRLRLDYDPVLPGTESYRTQTVWDFTSGRVSRSTGEPGYACGASAIGAAPAAQPCAAEPLVLVDYDVPLDSANRLGAAELHRIGLSARTQPGLPAPSISSARGWVSTDGGAYWRKVPAVRTSSREASLLVRLGREVPVTARVSLRIELTDRAGHKVTETLVDAFGISRARSSTAPRTSPGG